MIKVGERHYLIERASELPEPRSAPIYLDCETRSARGLQFEAYYPYLGDQIAMVGVTWEDCNVAYAVPVRMRDNKCNVEIDAYRRWANDLFKKSKVWRNHNPKFDWHFLVEDGIVVPDDVEVECTLTLAKILDSDRMGHDLKSLAHNWLQWNYSSDDRVTAFLDNYKLPRNCKARCYGLVPTDLLAEYNCDDVLANKALYAHIMANMPADSQSTVEMERKLTPALFDMERAGLKVDGKELKIAKAVSLKKMIKLSSRIFELTGREFVDSSKFSYGLLVGAWGLPILARNKKSGNPTFDADALKLYRAYPDVVIDPVKKEVLDLMVEMRGEETYSSLFLDSFIEYKDPNSFIHSSYNQIVRTGRMSCREPNTQQWDERAKDLIHCDTDADAFLYHDASQLEYRFIIHYTKDEEAIKAYRENPKTDFHQWAADMCGIDRSGGKTMNFSVSFGQGEQSTIASLAANKIVIEAVNKEISELVAAGKVQEEDRMRLFRETCFSRGKKIYRSYHDRFPGIKLKSEKAKSHALMRGYVFNVYGRRRHLPPRAARVAFNTVCQGGAADYVKRRVIQTSPRYNPEMRADGITLRANVHDSLLHHGSKEAIQKWAPRIQAILNAHDHPLSVPIYWDQDIFDGRWKKSKK